MYDCQTILKLLYPYLDGELDVKESLRVQAHLEECPFCLALYRQEKEFLQAYKTSIGIPPAPVDLRQKMSRFLNPITAVAPSKPHMAERARFVFPAPVLALTIALFFLVIGGIIFYAIPNQVNQTHINLIKTAVQNHDGLIKGKVRFDFMSDEQGEIINWLQAGLDFPVVLPQAQLASMHLIGGRMLQMGKQKAAIVTFQSQEGKVSLLMVKPHPLEEIEKKAIPFRRLLFYPSQYSGYYTLAWNAPKVSYVLVSDQKTKITEACRICHGGDARYDFTEYSDQI